MSNDPNVPIPNQPGTLNPPFVLNPTQDNPNPSVRDPEGNLWVWDEFLRTLRNTTAEAPVSPEQVLKNYQSKWGFFGVHIFVDGTGVAPFTAPLEVVRKIIRSYCDMLLIRQPSPYVQYQVWDFTQEAWVDVTTDPPYVYPSESNGVQTAEWRLNGGRGDKI